MKFSIECSHPLLKEKYKPDELIRIEILNQVDESKFIDKFEQTLEGSGNIEYLWDDVEDILGDENPIPQGSFDLKRESQAYYLKAKQGLNKYKPETNLLLTIYDDDNKPIQSKRISFFKILDDMLEQIYGDCGWDARLSGFIGARLMKFAQLSTWHYGLQKQSREIIEDISKWPKPVRDENSYTWGNDLLPIMWFGLDSGKPDSNWILWHRRQKGLSNLWSVSLPWEILEVLIANINDSFLIWYTEECNCQTPDIKLILEKCPVALGNRKTCQGLSTLMEEFFITQWNKNSKLSITNNSQDIILD